MTDCNSGGKGHLPRQARRLLFPHSRVEHKKDNHPVPREMALAEFIDRHVKSPIVRPWKDGPGVCLAQFNGTRNQLNTSRQSGMGFDLDGVDGKDWKVKALRECLNDLGWIHFAHTTFYSESKKSDWRHRWRLFLPFEHPFVDDPSVIQAMVEATAGNVAAALGIGRDTSCDDSARFFYYASCPEERRDKYVWMAGGQKFLVPIAPTAAQIAAVVAGWEAKGKAADLQPRLSAKRCLRDDISIPARGNQNSTGIPSISSSQEHLLADTSCRSAGKYAPAPPRVQIDHACRQTQPTRQGQRRAKLFAFARALKAIPGMNETMARIACDDWLNMALPVVGTKDRETSWADLCLALREAKTARGRLPVKKILDMSSNIRCSAAGDLPGPLLRLYRFCVHQSRRAGGPFPLPGEYAGEIVGAPEQHRQRYGSRALAKLCRGRWIEQVSKGSNLTGLASTYRVIPF